VLALVLLGFSLLYALIILTLAVAAWQSRSVASTPGRPSVSIVIAARNEEENIRACLDSIAALTYPRESLQVILVDDRSTDATAQIIQEYMGRHPHISMIHTTAPTDHLHGKANAIAQGVDHATGEILMFTDADCVVPVGWVEETVKYFENEKIGLVAGFTFLKGSDSFACFQALDWLALFSTAAAAVRLGTPATAVGTNLSVRKAAYDAIGGYRGIPFSVTEDYALFHAVASSGRYTVRFPMDPGTINESLPCTTWRQLYRQKKRWFAGGKGMLLRHQLVFLAAYAVNALLILVPILGWSPVWLLALGLKLAVDMIFTFPSLATFGRWRLLRCWPLYELYYFLYILIYPPIVLIGSTVVWKDRSFGH
jgi:1,2-diacylglycerol 3-beta-glucosyltransferase